MGKRIIEFIKYLFDSLISVIYTYECKCEICGEYLEVGDICNSCKEKIHFRKDSYIINKNGLSIKCYSVSYYSGNITKLILNFKYRNNFRCGEILGSFMIELIKREKIEFDFVTFVPMTKRSIKKRGYNQSKILAKIIGKKFEIKVIDCIKKVKETKDQIGLSAEQRWINVSKSFKFVSNKNIIGKNILLVDDVLTTGATTYCCAITIINNGGKNVIVLTVAKSNI